MVEVTTRQNGTNICNYRAHDPVAWCGRYNIHPWHKVRTAPNTDCPAMDTTLLCTCLAGYAYLLLLSASGKQMNMARSRARASSPQRMSTPLSAFPQIIMDEEDRSPLTREKEEYMVDR
ncbi:uncharacterized protein CLUP02_08394 [Colletotrichum lupini]|uniref:Uncharacterized protein n=1 Tax=Colletotrichum lupini TaxID=145971 RepID=A0A9Q8SSR1_9PEZI|nr:uncharacterized protein CLUP02_08394 [Colletotrichum lupini]UQC82904.1 hypothetical protein CLUP02_08394 [Colletotrichum lupini]